MVTKKSFLFYLPENSPFLSINAISKLLIVFTVSLLALSILDFKINLIIFLIAIFLLFIARVPLKNLKLWLYGFAFMLIFLTIMYTLLSKIPGEHVYIIFPWGTFITENTFPRALSVAFRIWSMIFVALIFLSTTSDTDIILALRELKFPYTFCFLISLSLRAISMFSEDWKSILDAYWSRGIDINKGNIIKRLRNYVSITIPLIIITLNKIKEVDYAAESRGFKIGIKNRTTLETIKWSIWDYAIVLTSILIIFISILMILIY
jgi:energy-coupling factor transport system permease protein